jgi:alpha-tubulin suppressor-like RCC1 family protein
MARKTRWALLIGVCLLLTALAGTPAWAVTEKPHVTQQPRSLTVEEGQNATFEAAGAGTPTPTIQWQRSADGGETFADIPNAHNSHFTVTGARASESGDEFRAEFTNSAGKAASEAATLTVQKQPTITKQPTSVAVEEGQTATFEAVAGGVPTPTVQWELSTDSGASWAPVEGASTDKLTIASAKIAENGDEYRAVFTNVAGRATSQLATLTVANRPVVTAQPVNLTVEVDQSASFEATASGFPAPSVQWEVSSNGGSSFSPLSGASADQLTIPEAKASENGEELRAVFTNSAGKATSEVAILTVALHHFRVLGWGQNSFGQLGDESFSQADLPVAATGLNFVTSVAAGRRHSLALLTNGTVVAWGDGASGQLGDGEELSSDRAVPVEGLTDVKAIAAGENFSLALLENGTVMAWGGNESGQLGDGTTSFSDVPVAVNGLSGVSAIAAGGEHALALLEKGTVMAWGNDEHGQLGDGGEANKDTPVAVKDLTGVSAIAAGSEHSLAVLAKGTVEAWGSDESGQLGNSKVTEGGEEELEEHGSEGERTSDVPVEVTDVSGATAVAAGAQHSLALLEDGTVMAWGEDESGQLGNGKLTHSQELPSAVHGLSGVSAIAAGGAHSMALLTNGTVMTWGEDKFGELGDGAAGEPSDVPVMVSGLGEAVGIAAGGDHDLVYSEPLSAVTAVDPDEGATAGGTQVTITGTNLTGATAVHFGANAATSFTVHAASSITAVAPAGALGAVNVTVTTAAGISPTTSADRFIYVAAPTVKSLAPKSGPGAGGSTVTITGKNLENASAVRFGGQPAASFTVKSATSITAVSPAGAGTVDVTVTTPGGTSATAKGDQFEYVPAVEAVSPGEGPTAGGTQVTITGSGFATGAGATTFKFGAKAASEVQCASTHECTAIAPAAKKAGTVQVVALVGKGKSASSAGDRFNYE